MSRSNSYNYTLTKDQAIRKAFVESGIYSPQDTISNADMQHGSDILNWMLKAWAVEGVHLWKRKQATLFPALSTASYELGSSGWHATNTYNYTTTTSPITSGLSIIPVTSSTGISVGDYIGIKLDNNTRQWSTVASVDSSTQITITAALTANVSSGVSVISYTTKINIPLRVLRGTKFNLINNCENKLKKISFDEYFDTPLKTITGDPNNFYYDRQLDNGILYLYPVTSNVDQLIKFTYLDLIMDMDNANDNFDMPAEWMYPIVRNLAVELARSKGNTEKVQLLEPHAQSLKLSLQVHDSDDEDLRIKIKYRYRR